MSWAVRFTFLLGALVSVESSATTVNGRYCPEVLAAAFENRLPEPLLFGVEGTANQRELLLEVFDPFQHFKSGHSDVFAMPLHYGIIHDRILFVHQRLRARRQRVDAVFRYWHTDWQYSDEPQGDANWEDLYRVAMLFGHEHLSEHPDSALVGLVSQLLYEELKWIFPQAYSNLLREQVVRLSENGFAHLGEDALLHHIDFVLRLRTVWINKYEYYRNVIQSSPQIRQSFMDSLMKAAAEKSLDAAMKENFATFYHLDSRLVDLLWTVPLPEVWEFTMSMPPVQRQGSVK